ncbi:MAG: glucosaminidase domain-containing protein [Paludibacter sp.]
MKNQTKYLIIYILLSICTLTFAQLKNQAYLSYINQYYKLAQKQQKEFSIPASITLAQGLLESGAGQSSFSKASNNHFGIKCNDWKGDKVYKDDDAIGECFRKYDHVLDSYEDHSLFLKNRSRYAFLFDLKPTDYEGWAFGLKKAGYATDPVYAFKLISIIENYNLHQFDLGKYISEISINNEPKSTTKKANIGSIGTIESKISHEVMEVNKTRFVTSLEADTYEMIADEFNLSEDKIREFNEVGTTAELLPGTRVYISKKKVKAPKECLTHKVLDGETMYSISQDYGIKVVELYKLNNMSFEQGAQFGRVLKLR